MKNTYLEELIEEAKNSRVDQDELECYLSQTPPSFEQCKEFFDQKGTRVIRSDYKKACEKIFKTPAFDLNKT